jgi:hypothetical protein
LNVVKARVSKNVGEGGSEESFGGADFLGLGKWCVKQRALNKSGLLTVEKQQVDCHFFIAIFAFLLF